MQQIDIIEPTPTLTLAELFRVRVQRSPDAIAYQHYDWGRQLWADTSWHEISLEVGRWQQAMLRSGLQKGDRVALMLRNSREWVIFDQAALGLGLITVPLYVDDRPGNAAHILKESGTRLLLLAGKLQWRGLLTLENMPASVEQIITVTPITPEDNPNDSRLESLSDWLFGLEGELQTRPSDIDDTATLVYTSGTTGNPKGVILSHRNILQNARNGVSAVDIGRHELFLSFLPLSHMFERTVSYYLPMMCGYTVAFSRSFQHLGSDFEQIKPTCFVSVPRVYERLYTKINEHLKTTSLFQRLLFDLTLKVGYKRVRTIWRQTRWSPLLLLWPILDKLIASKIRGRLGGRVHIALCGGAALSLVVDQYFCSLGLNLIQGYGLTEAGPVVSVNNPKDNRIGSIGLPLANTYARIANDGELQIKSASIMSGYWNNSAATATTFTEDGWLRTGDLAHLDKDGYIYLTGRIKEILILSNGEKVPPEDMETAITLDPLFEQTVVVGDNQPALAALIVLNEEVWPIFARENNFQLDIHNILQQKAVKNAVLRHISSRLKCFPGYAQIRGVHLTLEPWTVENNLLTSTMKPKRLHIMKYYEREIEALFNY